MPVANDWKFTDCTRKSEATCSSTSTSIVLFIDAASTPTADTTASPIISAEAVAPVRRGLRSVFSAASRPVVPKTFEKIRRQANSTG